MSRRHDAGFRARRDDIVRRLNDAVHEYADFTDDHEQQVIDTTAFRRAGPHEQGKSACLELTLRCYPSGKIELEPRHHTSKVPSNKSEMYNPPIAVPSVVGAVALLCLRGIEEAQTYNAEPEAAPDA